MLTSGTEVVQRVRSNDESNDVKSRRSSTMGWRRSIVILDFRGLRDPVLPEDSLRPDCREERVHAARDANGLHRMNVAFNYVVNRSASAIQVIPREPEFNITFVIIAL